MKLLHRLIEHAVLPEDCNAGLLVLEKPVFLVQFVRDLARQCEGEEGPFILADGLKELNLGKTLTLNYSCLNLEHNPHRAITALYKDLSKRMAEENLAYEVQEMLEQLRQKLSAILPDAEVELETLETPGWEGLLKFFDLKFKQEYDSIEEEICDYLKMMKHYLGCQVFVFVNCFGFLDHAKTNDFLDQLSYDGLKLLFVESGLSEVMQAKRLRTLIVDSELCEIEWKPV